MTDFVRSGPFYIVAENAPKLAIFTGLIYIIVTFFNFVTNGALSDLQTFATEIMIFGAIFCLPFAIFDIVFAGISRIRVDIIMMAFVNYFALLTAYAQTNWTSIKTVLHYILYVYLGMFVISMIIVVAAYLVWSSIGHSPGRKG